MNDDVERRFDRLTIRGVRPELREQVLGAVESELQNSSTGTEEVVGKTSTFSDLLRQPPPSPWLRRAAMATAVALLIGIGMNIFVTNVSNRRFAQLLGPPPVSKRAMEIAKDVEAITDAETGQWVYRQLTTPRRGDGVAAYAAYYDKVRRLIDELQTVSKDSYHETLQKNPEVDRGHTWRLAGRAAYCQCRGHLEDRRTA
jgi:hypothetical protein